MTNARMTRPASTPASPRTLARSCVRSSTTSAATAAAIEAKAPLAWPMVVRCALRNQPMTSASWTTRSAVASNTRPLDDPARTTTANSDVEIAASAAVSTARAEDPSGAAETEVTTSWSHPAVGPPQANDGQNRHFASQVAAIDGQPGPIHDHSGCEVVSG